MNNLCLCKFTKNYKYMIIKNNKKVIASKNNFFLGNSLRNVREKNMHCKFMQI